MASWLRKRPAAGWPLPSTGSSAHFPPKASGAGGVNRFHRCCAPRRELLPGRWQDSWSTCVINGESSSPSSSLMSCSPPSTSSGRRSRRGGVEVRGSRKSLSSLPEAPAVRMAMTFIPSTKRFSPDADWMSNVVLIAKMVYVWLDQLSETVRLAHHPPRPGTGRGTGPAGRAAGFTGLWLIGVWERSPASQRIKQIAATPRPSASAYSLYDYVIAADLGGGMRWAICGSGPRRRGIRLASDMVPNHTGIYSRWVVQHPDWFVQTRLSPYPHLPVQR